MADETVRGNDTSAFDSFVIVTGSRVRRALIASYGVEIGVEAASEAMRVAWEHWPAVAAMDNPAGFLYRAGQSSTRPHVRWAQRNKLFAIEEAPKEPDRAAVMDLLRGLAKLKPLSWCGHTGFRMQKSQRCWASRRQLSPTTFTVV
jgi:hypothetical protein